MPKRKTASERPPAIGDNSSVNDADARKLRGYVQEILRVEQERKALADEAKDFLSSAKDGGFSTKAIRRLVKLGLMDEKQRAQHEAEETTFDAYKLSCGSLFGTPLEVAMRPREFSAGDQPRTAMGE